MVELALVFLLGASVAGAGWLLLLPAIWRRAERLTRERLERALPINVNEILAERDRERAVHAVEALAQARRLDAMQAQVQAAKREVGDHVAREAMLGADLARREGAIVALQAEAKTLRGEIAARDARLEGLTGERAHLELRLKEHGDALDVMEARLAALREQLNDERRARDVAEVQAESARAAEAEERARALALRAEMMARRHESEDRTPRLKESPSGVHQNA